MFNLFGSHNEPNTNDNCNASGWTLRPSSTHRDDNSGEQCPSCDSETTTKAVRGRAGAVQLAPHRPGRRG